MKRKAIAASRSLWGVVRPGRIPASETEPFLARLLRNLPGMAYRRRNDSDWTMEFVSDGCRQLTGFGPQDLVGSRVVSYAHLIHPDDRDRVWRTVQRALDQDTPFRVTYRLRQADGTERWVWEQGVGVRGPDGRIDALEGFVTDITDRHELSEQVSRQQAHYEAVVDQSLAGVYVIREGRFLHVNRRFAEIFGYTIEEVKALGTISEVVHPDDRELVADNVRRRLEGEADAIRYEFRGRRKDGSLCDVEVHGRSVPWDGGRAVVGLLLDVTERIRAQRAYHGAKKMEALGQLAAGVAHDFNNALAVIQTTAQVAASNMDSDSELADDMNQIIAAVDRASSLCHQVMTFGRGHGEVPSDVSLPRLLGELAPILERLLGPSIELELFVQDDLPPLPLGSGRAEEVVMNLALNARDAMPDGGRLTIQCYVLTEPVVGYMSEYQDLPHVLVQVSDTGQGIPEDIRRQVFDPYFTTKDKDGTGLGLANVWRICNDAGGWVEVDSEVGVGTTFKAFFPVRSSEALDDTHSGGSGSSSSSPSNADAPADTDASSDS